MKRDLLKLLLSCAATLVLSTPALAGSFTVLHTFEGNKDGMIPESVLTPDGQGNFYGTTYEGGKLGFGTVFRIGADGRFSVVHAFKSGADGASPYAELTLGSDGALYG